MKKLLQRSLIGSLLLTASIPNLAATPSTDPDAPSPRITVYVYNYAEVPPSTLEGARGEASRILARAGVEVLWVECPGGERTGELVLHATSAAERNLAADSSPRKQSLEGHCPPHRRDSLPHR